MPPTIRDYRDVDEQSWLRCRALSLLGSAYYDDVLTERTRFDGESIALVAVTPKPPGMQTPGTDEVVGTLDVELSQDDEQLLVATVDTIAVHPDHQRQGLGAALLAEALARLATGPTQLLDAWTREDPAANDWYAHAGFEVDTEYLHVYASGSEPDDGFTTPEGLSTPVSAFCHGLLEDEARLRDRFSRVHRCRRYVRPVTPRPWTEDSRLAALYDTECAGRSDHDFYLDLADRLGAHRVTDIGCGTGVLAVDLAARGHVVTGLDPAAPMLAIARRRPGGERVSWVPGYADTLADRSADLVVMEGHVAQYFVTDQEWETVLRHAHRVLAPGGRVAFESRNPAHRAWESWTPQASRATYPHPEGSTFQSWVQVERVADDGGQRGPVITTRGYNVLPDGTHLSAPETLRFRSLSTLTGSLERAGFTIQEQHGDWDRSPISQDCPELILVARRD